MKRGAMILAVVGLASLTFAGGASAQKPEREVLPGEDEFPIEGLCDFPVAAEVEGTIIRTTFKQREVEVYPGYRITLTNVDTDESIVVIIPGPQFTGATTRIGTGPWLDVRNPETDEPGLFLLHGRWVATAEGTTFVGHVVDLCAELASG